MFEAKTHLPEIMRNVENGQEYCLTKRDVEIGFIIPVEQYYLSKHGDVFAELGKLKRLAPLGKVEDIINMRAESRK